MIGTVVIDGHIFTVRSLYLHAGCVHLDFIIPDGTAMDIRDIEYRVHGDDGTLIYIGQLHGGAVKGYNGEWKVDVGMAYEGKRSLNWKEARSG